MTQIIEINLESGDSLDVNPGDVYKLYFPNKEKTFVIDSKEVTCFGKDEFYTSGEAVIRKVERIENQLLVSVDLIDQLHDGIVIIEISN